MSCLLRARARALLLAPLLALLAACATSPAAPPTPPPTTAATPAAAAPTRAPATPRPTLTPAPTAEPDSLIVWAVADEARAEPLRRLLEETGKAAGIHLSVTTRSSGGLRDDVQAARLAGLPLPDVYWATGDDMGLLQREGLIQPAAGTPDAQALLPALAEQGTIDGRQWGTPVAAQGFLLLLYNRKLVDAPPATSDALIVSSRKQVSGDRYGLVAGWAEPRWLLAWLNGFGGAFVGPDGQPSLNTPQMLSALNLLKELRMAGPPPPVDYEQGVRRFRNGQAAFAIDGDWSLEGYRAYTDTLDLGVAPMPVVPATGRVAAPALTGVYLMLAKDLSGDKLDRARALSAALAAPEAQARIARDLGALPALRATLSDPAVAANPALAAAARQLDGAPVLAQTKAMRCSWEAVGMFLPTVLLGDLTQEDAAAKMQDRATACAATQ